MNDFNQNREVHLDWVRCLECKAYIEKADAIRTGGICPNCGASEGCRVEPDEETGFDFDARFTQQADIPDDFVDRAFREQVLDRLAPFELDPRD